MVSSGVEMLDRSIDVNWILMTDRSLEIPQEIRQKLGGRLQAVQINHERWPFPTLHRYKYLVSVGQHIQSEYLMHLDADMVFVSPVKDTDLNTPLMENDIACVLHPGFYRPKKLKLVKFYFTNLRMLLSDFLLFLRYGNIGTWETNKNSSAFVHRFNRKNYVCGGCWFGRTTKILEMASSLERNIELDLESNYIAKFHDESHLNSFIAFTKVKLLPPEFCFDQSYPQLKGLKPKIVAVDKNVGVNWLR